MSVEKRRAIASLGGKASSGNFKHDPERAREMGHRGGEASTTKFKVGDPQGIPAARGRKGGRARTRPME